MSLQSDDDPETPPELIDVLAERPSPNSNCGPKKVPITIVTEFGNTADIEKSLTVSQNGKEAQEWIPLANGCICCSVKDSGVAALESLVERQKNFDYILLETTGVADPGNIAPMFWMDEGLGSSIYLDGIVTVVDAKNVLKSLDEPASEELPDGEAQKHRDGHGSPLMTTAHLQISHADVVLLNKADLVHPAELSAVYTRLSSINGLARVITTSHSRVPALSGTLLDLFAYQSFTTSTAPPDFSSKGHSHLDPTISTVTMELPEMDHVGLTRLEECLQNVLWPGQEERNYEIHRTKGLIRMTDGSARVIQGVREIFEILNIPSISGSDDQESHPRSKVVLIGRGLNAVPLSLGWQ